jgi:hypothetical protein
MAHPAARWTQPPSRVRVSRAGAIDALELGVRRQQGGLVVAHLVNVAPAVALCQARHTCVRSAQFSSRSRLFDDNRPPRRTRQPDPGTMAPVTLRRPIPLGVLLAILGGVALIAVWGNGADELADSPETMERVGRPEQVSANDLFRTPADAAERRAEESGFADPRADRFVLIFADEDTVDLRVRVTSDDGCRWFGVVGFVEDNSLGWYAGTDGMSCDQ